MVDISLRRAKQTIRLEGTVHHHYLKADDDKIYGKIFVRTDEHSLHPVDVFESKYEIGKTGENIRPEFSKLYALMEILNEPNSEPVSVRLGNGSHLDVFAKYNESGELVERQIIKGKSIAVGVFDIAPQAMFRSEVWIESMVPVGDTKLLVNTWIPIAVDSVVPFKFYAYGDVAQYMLRTFNGGDTLTVNGKIVNETLRAEKNHAGFGTTWTAPVNTTTHEYVITGCDFAPYDAENEFECSLISLAIDRYKNELLPKLKMKAVARYGIA